MGNRIGGPANLEHLTNLSITGVDIAEIADGTYRGSFKAFPVSAAVEVTVKNHAITGIELLQHKHGQGAAAEIIPGRVVEAQSLEVLRRHLQGINEHH